MQVSDRIYKTPLADTSYRIAVVTALFNEKITEALAKGAREELIKLGCEPQKIITLTVPGAWELPFAIKALFQNERADAAIACGCVIRGDTGHYDIVANESARGLMQVALETVRPVMNSVLTVENLKQAKARAKADDTNKGREAARALVELINNLSTV
ncbi:MAG: 6,7-dimethyl-8-ribityllumazine synthase [Turneriella sp.]|nr:6,7-dimethyl-8-ribityllumazine synthase [Turneriella sp.]